MEKELLDKILSTFSVELQEQTQLIIDHLLLLEKNGSIAESIDIIFRAAHNIKGTSRGLGINTIGDIAHRLESLFSSIKKNEMTLTKDIIDASLSNVDKMRSCFLEYMNLNNDKNIDKNPQIKNTQPTNDMVHVSVEKINNVLSLMEEMQSSKIALEDLFFSLNTYLKDKNISKNDFHHSVNRLNDEIKLQLKDFNSVTNEIHEEIRFLRLVPASSLFDAFPRYVRDLSNKLDKKVDLTVIDDGIRVDKYILEKLKDPIMHILRNAIDHGIEDKLSREKANKPDTGKIAIVIKEISNAIVISIKDDGAGINKSKVLQSALDAHLITQEEVSKYSEIDIFNLIFLPGFSTKSTVTDISGRGVGLNVVKENLASIRGTVSVESDFGKSTTFILTVPITLSSERGFLFRCQNHLFIIPVSSVTSVCFIDQNAISSVSGVQVIQVGEKTIPLVSLAMILGLEINKPSQSSKCPVIIVKDKSTELAFIVDEIIEEREIFIKRLNAPLDKLALFSGGTLLDRNQVVLVLNANELLKIALQNTSQNAVFFEEKNEKNDDRLSVLVVDDSITTRTLEKNILENKNYNVTVAVNGKEAWDLLQKKKFSLLITDVSMPIMDGFTLTEKVKQSDALKALPVIIVTSLENAAEKSRGMEVGADAYIVKNEFESGMLLEIIDQLVVS